MKRDVVERFMEKVDITDTCWLWTASINKDGYGTFSINHDLTIGAHRASYEIFVGPIPEGFHVDHVRNRGCLYRHCVNPNHLEAVTPSDNVLRQRGDRCKEGHLFDRKKLRPDGTVRQRICSKCSGNRGVPL